jgi:hypothetical protein
MPFTRSNLLLKEKIAVVHHEAAPDGPHYCYHRAYYGILLRSEEKLPYLAELCSFCDDLPVHFLNVESNVHSISISFIK